MIRHLPIQFSKRISLAMICMAAAQLGLAQTANVTWQNPSTTNSFFYGVDAVNAGTVFVAGNRDGQFLKTTNGGNDWSVTGYPDGLWAVDFVNATTGWTVTNAGRILKTTDGGATFVEQNTGLTKGGFWDVQFINENKGWVVGKGDDLPVILYTSNGGATWQKQQHDSFSANGFTQVFFLNENIGWVSGYEYEVYKTTNGGATWTKQTTTEPNQNFAFFSAMKFVDENTGYACTTISGSNARLLIKTVDGGATWTKPTQPALSYIGGLHLFDADNVLAAGGSGKILRTTDGGTTWTEKYSAPGLETFLSMAFADANVGYAVGSAGLIVKTTDGGETWTSLRKGASVALRSACFTSNQEGWVVGNTGTILYTSNEGNQWSAQASGVTTNLNKVFFTDNTTGWAAGDAGTILKTTNKGEAWSKLASGTKKNLRAVYFVDGQKGWAVGDTLDRVLVTTDGGAHWDFKPTGVSKILRSVYFQDATHGWTVGDGGTILATADGGATWTPQTSGTTQTLNSVVFVNATTGWAFGNLATILSTTDGGATWTPQVSPIINENNDPYLPVDLFEGRFVNDSTGFVIGRQAVLLSTTDAGKTWVIDRNMAGTYNSIFFTSPNRGWMAGNSGVIVKYSLPPTISNFTPETAGRDEQVTITGYGFVGAQQVKLGDAVVTFEVKSNQVIVATVPEGFAQGKVTVTTPEGVGVSSADFVTSIATGIDETEGPGVSVYPNPSTDLVNIDLRVSKAEALHIGVLDMAGKLVDTRNYNLSSASPATLQYSVAHLPAGLYILEFQSGTTRAKKKIIVLK